MKTWPGTNIPKSTGNVFDWRRTAGVLAAHMRETQMKADAGLKGAQAQQNRMPDGSPQKV